MPHPGRRSRPRETSGSRRAVAVVLAAAAALVLGACAQARPDAAVVEGREIPRSELEAELSDLVGTEAFRGALGLPPETETVPTDVADIWLRIRVQQSVIDEEFERRGLEIDDGDVAEARDVLANAQLGLLPPDVFGSLPSSFADELATRTARQLALGRDLPAATCASGIVVSHVLVETEAEADEVLAELAGGADFAALAEERSVDPGSASTGGRLGCLEPGVFVPEFEEAVLDAPTGEPTGPVATDFGFHVILVEEPAGEGDPSRTPQEALQALGGWLTVTLPEAEVEVDPRYGEWVVDETGAGIVPPTTARVRDQREPAPASEVPTDVDGLPLPTG